MYRELALIETDEIKYIWPALVPFVERLKSDEFTDTVSDIENHLRSGTYHCWLTTEFEEITAFVLFRQEAKTITILGISGKKKSLKDSIHSILSMTGCIHVKMKATD